MITIQQLNKQINKAKKFINKRKKLISIVVIVLLLVFAGRNLFAQKQNSQQYQTAKTERGILVTGVSASGQVSSTNSYPVTTQASGIVSNVYIKNGDTVEAGQKIADIILDQLDQQKQAQAWSSYLSAQNTLNSAQAKINSLQSTLFKTNQTFMNGAAASNLGHDDPKYIEQNAEWLQAEADYKNQQGVIAQAQAAVNSAWLTYQQTSSTITAPAAGVITGLYLQPGTVISGSQSNAASGTISSQKVAAIQTGAAPTVTVNLSEVDVPKVKIGQKATITFDALSDKTFTGSVSSIDAAGSVSSGVTTYLATIVLDVTSSDIFPNMTATANIITDTIDNILLVPSSAVQTQSGQSVVRVLNNDEVVQITVEIGKSSDSQIEIISGLSEGDEVITGSIPSANIQQGNSPFGTRGFGSGGIRTGGMSR